MIGVLLAPCVSFNTPRHIPDGVLVTGGTAIQRQAASWSVYITLEAPTFNFNWVSAVTRIQTVIDQLVAVHRATNASRSSWAQRLTDLTATFTSSARWDASLRDKRALFDLGGDILSKIFGVATERQVAEVRRWIERVRHDELHVVHDMNHLITLVNHTYTITRVNRQHIRELEQYVSKLEHHVMTWMTAFGRDFDRRLNVLTACLNIDDAISGLISLHNRWLRQMATYDQQRDSLESGRLTEVILAPAELAKIVREGNSLGFSSPHLEWFYEHVIITPMWKDHASLVFTANLPLTDNVEYLRYYFWTWPVMHHAEFTMQLRLPPTVAYNTRVGSMFLPRNCVGRDPAICMSGPIYNNNGLRCPRGVLTNDDSHRKQCFVTVRGNATPSHDIQELQEGTFAILSPGEPFKCYCAGQASITGILQPGLSVLTVKPRCRISGQSWTLQRLYKATSTLAWKLPIITVHPFNLSTTVSHTAITKLFPAAAWKSLPVLPDVKLHTFFEMQDDDNFSDINWDGYVDNLPFLNFALLLMLFTVAGVGVYFYLGRPKFCLTGISPTPQDTPLSADTTPATDHTLPVGSAPQTLRAGDTVLLPGEPSSSFFALGSAATQSNGRHVH